jgi:hypothetical protein
VIASTKMLRIVTEVLAKRKSMELKKLVTAGLSERAL